MTGAVELPALEAAIRAAMQRHEVLRTVYVQEGGFARPELRDAAAFALGRSHCDSAALQAVISAHAAQPFDLAIELPLRAHWLALGLDDGVLLLTLHHIACDGVSIGILAQEIARNYTGAQPPQAAPADALQYADFACWQRDWLAGPARDQLEAWWRDALEGAPAVCTVDGDRARPVHPDLAGAAWRQSLPAALAQRLRPPRVAAASPISAGSSAPTRCCCRAAAASPRR